MPYSMCSLIVKLYPKNAIEIADFILNYKFDEFLKLENDINFILIKSVLCVFEVVFVSFTMRFERKIPNEPIFSLNGLVYSF